MKYVIMGYSGSGKSTLCRMIAARYKLPSLHLDRVQFLPGWQERPTEEKCRIVEDFLDTHESWIIDGNYTALCYERRVQEADQIILMLFGRFDCLCRCFRRYLTYHGKTRPDMGEGCHEKFDLDFIRWILWAGRSKVSRQRYRSLEDRCREKVTVLRCQADLTAYIKTQGFARTSE